MLIKEIMRASADMQNSIENNQMLLHINYVKNTPEKIHDNGKTSSLIGDTSSFMVIFALSCYFSGVQDV